MLNIPENLHSLHRHEEAIREKSLTAAEVDLALCDNLQAIHDALDHLTVLLKLDSNSGDDQHTLQLFVIRLFNTGASALKLGLSGYYQQAFLLLRDSLEIVNLVDLFRADSTKIYEWRTADNKKLKKDFGPSAVRSALERFPQYAGQKAGRDKTYAQFSKFAAHATYDGFRLAAPNNEPRLGPFYDQKLLRAILEDTARHLSHAVMGLSTLLGSDGEIEVFNSKMTYLNGIRQYYEKYIKR